MIDTGPVGGEVTFPDGLPGYEDHRRFVLVASPSLEPFTLVRGLQEHAPAFLAIDPRAIDPDFTLDLRPADFDRLGTTADRPLLWLAMVSAPAGEPATVNLRAPLVISPDSMRGVQLVREDAAYRFDHPLPTE